MKRILVTGGAGFIGSHTCLELLRRDYEIFLLDSFVNSSKISINKVLEILKSENNDKNYFLKVYKGDLRDKNFIESCFNEIYESGKIIDGVIHFAGLKSVKESINYPISYWDTNVLGTINLINIMKKFNCETFVFSSSATVYGTSSRKKLKENDQVNPINPYGTTKLVNEDFLREVFQSGKNSWRIACLRYFNPIGAHSSGLIGESPTEKPNNIFPLILNVASHGLEKLEIYGNNWPTEDGTPIRDYIHVMDLAEGHIRILEYLLENDPQYLNLNLGTGKGTSVLELIKTFEKVNKLNVPFVFSERRPGDCAVLVADNSKLISTINWSPQRNLNDMCRDGWIWKKNSPFGFN